MISDIPQAGRRNASFLIEDLLRADWESSTGPLKFPSNLTAEDLLHAPFFLNCRVFMRVLADDTADMITATGNLNRAFVSRIFDQLILPESYRQSIGSVCKVVNELDLWPLHLVRVVAECAKLVVRRNKRFQLTKIGRELLQEDLGGELYRRLFIAYFRRFDLRYDFFQRDVPSLQRTMAVILWRLSIVARDWIPVRNLAPQLLLPEVLDELRATMLYEHDTEEWILGGYVLDPLCDFGLIEAQKGDDWRMVTDRDFIRTSKLWNKFSSFPGTPQPGGNIAFQP